MISDGYPHVNRLKNVSYPQVYPQINLTDIFNIWFWWRKREGNGLLSDFIRGFVMSGGQTLPYQTLYVKPLYPHIPLIPHI